MALNLEHMYNGCFLLQTTHLLTSESALAVKEAIGLPSVKFFFAGVSLLGAHLPVSEIVDSEA